MSEKVECDSALQWNSVQHEIVNAIIWPWISHPSVAQTNDLHNPLTEMKGCGDFLVSQAQGFVSEVKQPVVKGAPLWRKLLVFRQHKSSEWEQEAGPPPPSGPVLGNQAFPARTWEFARQVGVPGQGTLGPNCLCTRFRGQAFVDWAVYLPCPLCSPIQQNLNFCSMVSQVISFYISINW